MRPMESTEAPALNEFTRALSERGWRVTAYPGFAFGSWAIDIDWSHRVTYNGRDGVLELECQRSPDNCRKVWTAPERRDQTPAALIAVLLEAR
jgi:hypothetical protein